MNSRVSWDQYWQQMLAENDAAKSGWLALLLFPALPNEGLLALLRALSGLVGVGETRPYQKLSQIVPAVAEEVQRQMTTTAQLLGKDSVAFHLDVIRSDVETLVEQLNGIPERSVVIVHCLELFHGKDSTRSPNPIKTWSGTPVTFSTLDERFRTEIEATVERLLPIADKRQLLIVAHAGLSLLAAEGFKPELRSARNLCIWGGKRTQDRYDALISRLLSRLNAGNLSLDRARSLVRRAMPEPDLRAQAEAQLLCASNRFDEAWLTIEPHLGAYDDAPSAICLGIARIAHAAFHPDEARDWLKRGVVAGPRSFADLRSAWQLGCELDEKALSEELFEKLASDYPNEPLVIREQATRSLGKWCYAEAVDYARRAGLYFYAAVWDAFAGGKFDLEATLRLARNEEDNAYIHWRAALDSEHSGDLDSAILFAACIPETSEHHDRALALRLRLLGRGLLHQQQVTDADLDELMPLIVAVAIAPYKMKARIALECLMEETIGAHAALTLLCPACEQLLPAVLAAANSAPRAQLFPLNEGDLANPDEVLAFSRELSETALTDLLMVGRGELPATMKSQATPELVRALLFINQRMDLTDHGSRIATHRLWEIELVCRALGEPSKDCLAAAQLVRGLARQGERQSARDLAEEALRTLPNTQPMHRLWRTGLAWMVYAEAFHWTSNPMAALRCAALMLAAWQSSVREAEVVCEGLNLLARIYRDLHLTPLALRCLKEEKRLRTNCGAIEMIFQLEALMLDLEGQMLEGADRAAWLRHFASLLRAWRQLPEHAERLPLLSRIISIGRNLRVLGASLPEALVAELDEALIREQSPPVAVLHHMLTTPPTRVEFLDIVKRFDSAVRKDDLKTQLSTLRALAEDTIEAAARTGDADLFFAAFGVLAQPVLTATANEPENAIDSDITTLYRHAMEAMADMDHGAIQDMDAILRRVGRPSERRIASACEITATQFAAMLRPAETALLLAHSGNGRLCACQVSPNGNTSLWIAPEESWSELRFLVWQRRFPSAYWFSGAPGGAGWAREHIQETLNGLGLYLLAPMPRVTVIPSADLFLFPFTLAAQWRPMAPGVGTSFTMPAPISEFLGEGSVISTAPSAQWLITMRATPPPHQNKRMAWIGGPQTSDEALRDLRETLRWQLQAHGIQVIEAERPTEMAGASLAIVVAHGTQAEGREFHALGDGINRFDLAEVSSWLEGCSCVVVAVCHGGAAAAETHSYETRGLVSAILSAGVRTVIACPWPLGTDVVVSWMPQFLQSIAAGETVAEAAFAAANQVKSNVADAAAWAAMQVFGDGNVTVANLPQEV